MSTTQVVYEDEILPEIEIRELMTLEDILADDPTFIAFSHDEIVQNLRNFVTDVKKSEALASLILQRTTTMRDKIEDYVIPVLSASRAVNDDDITEYIERLEEIKNAPNYTLQQQMLSRLLYPIDRETASSEDSYFVATHKTEVGIDGGVTSRTVLLPSDDTREHIVGGAIVIPSVTHESYLYEKVGTTVPHVSGQEVIRTSDLSTIKVPFASVVRLIEHIPDIHFLRVHLARFGLDFDTLSEEEIAVLIQHINSLDDQPDVAHTPANAASPQSKFVFRDFYQALQQLPSTHLDKEKYSMMYESLVATFPQERSWQDMPLVFNELAKGIRENSFTLDEVIAFLKQVRAQYIINQSLVALKQYLDLHPDAIPEHLSKIIDKWVKKDSFYVDRTARRFVDIYKDVSEVKEGNDTSKYDGSPRNTDEQVYEEIKYDYVDEIDDSDEVIIESSAETLDMRLFERYSQGTNEVLIPVIRKISTLQTASAVPVDIPRLISYIAPKIVRISCVETLEQEVPDLSVDIRNQIATSTFDTAVRIASGIIPQELSDRTVSVIRRVFKDLYTISKLTFIEAFCWVVLQTIEASLEKRLEFDPMNGMLSCIRLWSPFGAPVTKDKEQEGVLYYLSCVASETDILTEFKLSYDSLIAVVMQHIQTHMQDTLDILKVRYTNYAKENTITISKARQANLSLAEAIQLKLKKRILTDYVRAMLYIPGMISTSKHPSHALGCCMQQLGADYVADSDWQDMKKLKGVKDQFAKKRMTKITGPPLAWIAHAPESQDSKRHDVRKPTVRDNQVNMSALQSWFDEVRRMNIYLLPVEVIDRLQQDPTSLGSFISGNVATFLKTIGKKNSQFESLFTGSHISPSLLDIVAKNLLSNIPEDEYEKQVIQTSIQHIVQFKQQYAKLSGVYNHIDQVVVNYMLKAIISNAICLPADSRDTRNGRLIMTDRVRSAFLPNILQQLYSSLLSTIKSSAMPTPEEQQAFITRMRELQKIETLRVLNSQTEEDRQTMVDAKKFGLFKVEHPKDNDQPEIVEDDDDGEQEFRYLGEDMELGDDELGM